MKNPTLAQMAEATSLKLVKSEFESLKWDHPIYKLEIWKIYGPYLNKKDKRLRIIVYDGYNRVTISYPRFIIECKYKKILARNEDIHHIDEDINNNLINNFEIIKESEHKKHHKLDSSLSMHGTYLMCIKLGCRCSMCHIFLITKRKKRKRYI